MPKYCRWCHRIYDRENHVNHKRNCDYGKKKVESDWFKDMDHGDTEETVP